MFRYFVLLLLICVALAGVNAELNATLLEVVKHSYDGLAMYNLVPREIRRCGIKYLNTCGEFPHLFHPICALKGEEYCVLRSQYELSCLEDIGFEEVPFEDCIIGRGPLNIQTKKRNNEGRSIKAKVSGVIGWEEKKELLKKIPSYVMHCKTKRKPLCRVNLSRNPTCGFNGTKYCLFSNPSQLRCTEGNFRKVQFQQCTEESINNKGNNGGKT